MQYDAEFVEYIVREVIRRLTAGGANVAQGATEAAVPKTLTLAGRLITLETLNGKLDGITEIAVLRRAVVTPAARDELKRRMIQLKRG